MSAVRRHLPGGRRRAVVAAFEHGYEAGQTRRQRVMDNDPVTALDAVHFIAEQLARIAGELANDMAYIEKRIIEAKYPTS